jgi:hypothetical protein
VIEESITEGGGEEDVVLRGEEGETEVGRGRGEGE